MRAGRVVALVIGSLLAIVGVGLLFGAGALGLAIAVERDDDGYFEITLDRIESDAVAVVSDDLTFAADPGTPDWVLDMLDVDVRLTVTSARDLDVFVGIGRAADVERYVADVQRDDVVEVDGRTPVLRSRDGGTTIDPPAEQDFWAESASGIGTQAVEWEAQGGRWAALVMNADGTPGVTVDVDVGARAGIVVPVAITLLVVGLLVLLGGVALIVFGAVGLRRDDQEGPASTAPPSGPGLAPPVTTAAGDELDARAREPVSLRGRLDPDVSSWQWLVKWFLAIPHMIVLAFLWIALVVTTLIAGIAVLFTGRYPRGLFDFGVGVLRWSWRVTFYAFTGGLGTDRYPPFTLASDPAYPADFDVEYPERLSRGLVLVKWWLLAIPHYILLTVFLGSSSTWAETENDSVYVYAAGSIGLLEALSLIAAVALLFRGRHIGSLFRLIVGVNRWVGRVVAYVLLMTDRYPPFRLDQGEDEPGAREEQPVSPPETGGPGAGTLASWSPPTPAVPSR